MSQNGLFRHEMALIHLCIGQEGASMMLVLENARSHFQEAAGNFLGATGHILGAAGHFLGAAEYFLRLPLSRGCRPL